MTTTTSNALQIVVRISDGQTVDIHGARERPLRAVSEEVAGKLHLSFGTNQIVYFMFEGTRYDLDKRLGDIAGLTDGDVLSLMVETRSG